MEAKANNFLICCHQKAGSGTDSLLNPDPVVNPDPKQAAFIYRLQVNIKSMLFNFPEQGSFVRRRISNYVETSMTYLLGV